MPRKYRWRANFDMVIEGFRVGDRVVNHVDSDSYGGLRGTVTGFAHRKEGGFHLRVRWDEKTFFGTLVHLPSDLRQLDPVERLAELDT